MKLLIITGDRSLAQGKKGAFYNTLAEFHKYWDQVDIICPSIFNFQFSIFKLFKPKTHNLKPITCFSNVFIHPSPWPLIFQPFWILRKGLRILKTSNYKPETRNYLMTVHEYPPFYNGVGARLLWDKIKIPYILEIHHIPGYPRAVDFKEYIYQMATELFIKYDANKARVVRVVNQRQVPEFLKKAGIPTEKIKYIPSAYIDLNIFRPMQEVEKKYDLVFAGRLEKNKGIGLLLQAMSKVKAQMPNVKLLIIGSGPELNRIKLQTTNYKLQTNVFFSGWLETADDVAHAYNSARIFVNPSFNEGGPRVVLEAMACELPVITTRVGLMVDIIKNGSSGTSSDKKSELVLDKNGLFADWNPHSMVDRILYLLHSEKLQKRFSSAGLELVKQFEKKAAIKNYAEELKKLI